ncbi:MAG: nucleotidyltransferase domain-containing protein [Rhodoferax sp.]|nr:nucleotidyltransferase domain-containing protein [Rhodoferax sp.]
MRLNTAELNALRTMLGELDPGGQIYLSGSRAVDSGRGGDIDVYLQASRPIDLKTRLRTQYRLQQACDTRVDLLVKNPSQPVQPIHLISVERVCCYKQRTSPVVSQSGGLPPAHSEASTR